MTSKKFDYTLGVITQTRHWKHGDEWIAYEPYVREMRLWADMFESVNILTAFSKEAISVNAVNYDRDNVRIQSTSYDSSVKRFGWLTRLAQLPRVVFSIMIFVARHEVILVRSPGHFGLLGNFFVWLFRKRSITKFAGFFGRFPGERMPSILERLIISKLLKPPHYVLIYGVSDKSHLISFIPAVMTLDEIRGLHRLKQDHVRSKLVFYSLGKLIPVKGFDLAIAAFGKLKQDHPELVWEYHLLGDGPQGGQLRGMVRDYGIENSVFFHGALSYLDAMQKLSEANVLVMPGVMEGWPKVVIEAWAVGVIPLVAEAGILPMVVQDGVNGFLFKPDAESLKQKLASICKSPLSLADLRATGLKDAEDFSMERFSKGIEDICLEKLGLNH